MRVDQADERHDGQGLPARSTTVQGARAPSGASRSRPERRAPRPLLAARGHGERTRPPRPGHRRRRPAGAHGLSRRPPCGREPRRARAPTAKTERQPVSPLDPEEPDPGGGGRQSSPLVVLAAGFPAADAVSQHRQLSADAAQLHQFQDENQAAGRTGAGTELQDGDQPAGPPGLPAGLTGSDPLRRPAALGAGRTANTATGGTESATRAISRWCPRPTPRTCRRDPGLPQPVTQTAAGVDGQDRPRTGARACIPERPSSYLGPGGRHARILAVTGGVGPASTGPTGRPSGGDTLRRRHGGRGRAAGPASRPAPSRWSVRADDGRPAVIANAPFLFDGTPMPTRYWLVDPDLREAVSTARVHRRSPRGGVGRPADQIAAAHARYAEERDAADPADHAGRGPRGGWGAPGEGSSACTPTWPGG